MAGELDILFEIAPAEMIVNEIESLLDQILDCNHFPVTYLDDFEKFNMKNNKWENTYALNNGDAIRTKISPRLYGVIYEDEWFQTDFRTAKLVNAMCKGRKPFAFEKEKHELYTRLGAELPNFFGKAATLASGERMEKGFHKNNETNEKPFAVQIYRDISAESAQLLFEKLMSVKEFVK